MIISGPREPLSLNTWSCLLHCVLDRLDRGIEARDGDEGRNVAQERNEPIDYHHGIFQLHAHLVMAIGNQKVCCRSLNSAHIVADMYLSSYGYSSADERPQQLSRL